jgi:hypothetical protein
VLLSVFVETAATEPSAMQWGAYVKPWMGFDVDAGSSPSQGVLLGFYYFD